jgi:carbon monoxide dehydrogenase subunit G
MHRVVVAAPPDQIWKSLQRPESWSRIGGVNKVTDPTFDSNGEITGYRFTVEVGGSQHLGTATRSDATPSRRLAMTIDTDQLGGHIDVELEPTTDQTAVTVAMTVQSKGMMTAMLFPVITGAIASGFNESVEQFAAGLAEGAG